ncbi:MAG TPA: type II secretion system F family protein [Tepidisphaeraceae bacterium]|jgi:type II secretory pathway component PulF
MPVYAYKAMRHERGPADGARAEHSGTIAADTPRQARDLLRERGLVVRDLAAQGKARGRAGARRVSRSIRARVTAFVRELSTLLAVGVPMLEALETLARQHAGRFRTILLLLRDQVAAGASLAAAMREHPGVFDELAINITDVGEDAGTLDASLQRLAEFRERGEQFRGRLMTALIYPAIVLTVAVAASLFLMAFVVPRILEPLIEQGQALPLPTRIVKGASDFLIAWWWLIAACGFALFIAVATIVRAPRGRLAWHRFLLRIPVLGDLARKQAIVRICVVIGTLLKSGVVFVRAVQIAQRTTGNLVLRQALVECERAITAGGDIAQAIERTGAFPPMVVQVFAVGQQSGRLEEMLERLAETYDQQVSTAAARLTAILEPALIVLLALVVLFIVLATVLPILEAGNAIQ